jgi:N-acetylglucosaminyl-diphospho-decaprenol L-rhamnosyltransferase
VPSRVDVVMVSWNDKANVATALESVFALSEVQADPDFANVVVSDNGSTDGTLEFIRERYGARVTVIENGANLGFGAACNRAFVQTSAPYVFLLNPDAELKNRALAAVVAFFDEHPRCGIAGSRLHNTDGSIQPSCGEFDTWTGAFLRSSAWGELPPFRRFANGAALRGFTYDQARQVDLVIGAAVGLRRTMLDEIGIFDERFFLYHEEVDLARRAATAGWETWFVPTSEAVHEGMGSAKGQYQVVESRKQKSRRQYWIKHHGYAWYLALVAALVGRFALYLIAAGGALIALRRIVRGK